MIEAGVIPLIELSALEKRLYIKELEKRVENADLISELFGNEFIYISDALAGINLKFPSRVTLSRIIVNTKIYTFCKNHNFSESAITDAAHIFKRTTESVRRICNEFKEHDNIGCKQLKGGEENGG